MAERRGARPKRALGQNFLVDPGIRRRIVEEAGILPGETVLEIGPGRGALTDLLAERAHRLVLVELDDALAAALAARFRDQPSVTVLHRDILDVGLEEVEADPTRIRVVGNIPYNITSPIVFHLLEPPRPREILLMVQREVADRILADPGTKAYGALSIGVRTVARVAPVLRVPRTVFRPRPKVDSTVLRITPFAPAPLDARAEQELRTVTRAAFQWRRKQWGRILREHPDLRLGRIGAEAVAVEVGFALTDRPESLSPEDFVRLSRAIAAQAG